MNGQHGMDTTFYVLLAILPLSALLARRLRLSQVVRMILAWVAIFAMLLLVVTAASQRGLNLRSIADTLGLSDQSVSGRTVSIPKGPDGHFYATVTIGKISRRLLIDSGATTTMISKSMADAADIDATGDSFGTIIQTANGPIIARRAVAPSIAIGPIEARNLDILVDDHFDGDGVIGMNFLSSLRSWRVEGDRMILEPRKL